MSAIASPGSSCSTTYHSTPAARPASMISGNVQRPRRRPGRHAAPSPGARSFICSSPDASATAPDLGDRVAAADRRPVDVELELDLGRELGQQHVPDRRALERFEFERVVVIAERGSRARRSCSANSLSSAAKRWTSVGGPRSSSGSHGTMTPRAAERGEAIRDGRRRPRAGARCLRATAIGREAGLVEEARRAPPVAMSRQPRELDRPVAGRRRRPASVPGRSVRGQAGGRCRAGAAIWSCRMRTVRIDGVRSRPRRPDAVASRCHDAHSVSASSEPATSPAATPRDILDPPRDPARRRHRPRPGPGGAFGEAHGCRAHASLDELLADDEVDIVVNLTVHHAHYEVTKRALEAGRHVYSEKPLALRLDRGARARRPRRGARAPARLLAVDVPRRGPADRRGADPGRPARARSGRSTPR